MAAPSAMGLTTGDLYAIDLGDTSAPPTLVESLRGEHVLEMSGAFAKTALLTGNGIAHKAAVGSATSEPLEELRGLDGMLAYVAFGYKHMAALTHSGQVYTLGAGDAGQLGHGDPFDQLVPKLIESDVVAPPSRAQ